MEAKHGNYGLYALFLYSILLKDPNFYSQNHANNKVFCLVTCVDPRTIPEQFFGPGFRSSVYRNAGGRVTDDVVRTLNILRPLGNVKLVLVVHHTGT